MTGPTSGPDKTIVVSHHFHGHVLDEVSLCPAQHLHERVFSGQHVEVVGVQDLDVFREESLVVVHSALWRRKMGKKDNQTAQ